MTRVELRIMMRPFGLKVLRIKPCASLYKPNAAFHASTNGGQLAIKPYRAAGSGAKAARQFAWVVSCMRTLVKYGYPHMPRWRKTRFGGYGVKVNGRLFYMTEWVEGGRLSITESDLERLGQALGRLHLIGKRYGVDGDRFCTAQQIKLLKSEEAVFRKQLRKLCKRATPLGKWLDRHQEEAEALSRKAFQVLGRGPVRDVIAAERRNPRLTHGDVTLPNVIKVPDGVKLIDWDLVAAGSTYIELAKTLANTTAFHTDMMAALVRGYEEIRPLQPAERQLVAALFRFPREVWYAANNAVNGHRNDIFSIVADTWERRLTAVEWMDQWAGKKTATLDSSQERRFSVAGNG